MTLATLDELITEAETSSPRVYVACLASYNSGVLHGTWIDLISTRTDSAGDVITRATDADEMREAIAAMLRQSPYPSVDVPCPHLAEPCRMCLAGEPCIHWCDLCRNTGKVPSAEEYAIHDYDGFGELSTQLGEYPDLETVAMHARMIDQHGDAWFAYCDWQDTAYQSEDDFEEKFQGEYDSPADYAEQLIEDCYDLRDVPDIIKYHIDYDCIANDMRLGGDNYFAQRGGVTYVFDAH